MKSRKYQCSISNFYVIALSAKDIDSDNFEYIDTISGG